MGVGGDGGWVVYRMRMKGNSFILTFSLADGDEPPNPPEEGGAAPPGAPDEVPGEVVMVKKKIKRVVKRKKHKKVKVRYMLSKLEVDTTTEFLKPVAWLGTLPSEAAKANNHDELAKVSVRSERGANEEMTNTTTSSLHSLYASRSPRAATSLRRIIRSSILTRAHSHCLSLQVRSGTP